MRTAIHRGIQSIKSSRRNSLIAVLAALAVGVMGFALFHSLASGFFASVEPEDGTLTSNAKLVSDSTAAGGKAIQFTAPAPAPPPPGPTPPPPPPGGCAPGVTGLVPACTLAPPAPAASGKHWNVTFSEEFNNGSYDPTKLTPCFDWNSGDCTATFNQGYEYYEPSAISVATNSQGVGLAHLNATPLLAAQTPIHSCGLTESTTTTATHRCNDSACLSGTCLYKSGLISTARKLSSDPATAYLYKFTYGYVEASLQVPNTQGFFIAWWMLPADPTYNYTYTPSGTPVSGSSNPPNSFRYEIDILEELGSDPTDMEMHYSWGDGSNYYSPNDTSRNGTCAQLDYSQGQHRFGVDWEPSYVAFYIDGIKCGQHNATSGAPTPNVPMQLIMDQMVNNNWQRSIGKPLLNTSLSNDVQVDYIRVYQQQ